MSVIYKTLLNLCERKAHPTYLRKCLCRAVKDKHPAY